MQNVLPYDRFPYCLGDIFLDYVEFEKDLGVYISTKLSWAEQSDAPASKAKRRHGMVKTNCHFVDNVSQKKNVIPLFG